jgi:hypothetical protein
VIDPFVASIIKSKGIYDSPWRFLQIASPRESVEHLRTLLHFLFFLFRTLASLPESQEMLMLKPLIAGFLSRALFCLALSFETLLIYEFNCGASNDSDLLYMDNSSSVSVLGMLSFDHNFHLDLKYVLIAISRVFDSCGTSPRRCIKNII